MNPQRRVVLIALASLAFLFPPSEAKAATQEDFGQLIVRRDHVNWPSPLSVIRDLSSPDSNVRFKALLLVGVPEKLARIPVWNNATPAAVIGSEVVKPEQIGIRYAALGSDETQQAIVVAQVVGTYAFAAVAAQKLNGWERIAQFNCWCKYDAKSVIDSFVSLSVAPDAARGDENRRYELVLRASGGGTGLYRQDEVHFRLYKGEMKAVISFVSRVQSVPITGNPPPYLQIERRWFYPTLPIRLPEGRSESAAVLVESRGKTAVPPDVFFSLRQLQDRYLKGISCRTFRWDQVRFRYEPVTFANACTSPDN
jgi:hypothetical protein